MGACRNETCVLCQAKNRHQRCHCSIVENVTPSANLILKSQNHAKEKDDLVELEVVCIITGSY